jgi:hypothetical protein
MAVESREWSACSRHASAAERDECLIATAEFHAREEGRFWEIQRALPVECWSWPVTAEHRQLAVAAQSCPDEREARDMAWKLLSGWQMRRCAICADQSRFLDHSHETGLVRGWLCRSCNVSEGFADVPGGRFERYRAKNPASILGLRIRYYSTFTGWAVPAIEAAPDADRSPGYTLASYLAGSD